MTATTMKDTSVCHPLAAPVCLKLSSPFASSRGTRIRRKEKKLGPLRKPCVVRCLLTASTPQQQPSPPTPSCIDIDANHHLNEVPRCFASTPSEYAAYKAKLNRSSNVASCQTTCIPACTISDHTLSSSPVINLIPSLSLNLGLNRIPSLSSSSSSLPSTRASVSPHTHSFSSSQAKSRRRVSKSDVSEAHWWIRMYESLGWYIKQQRREFEPSSHDLAFLTRLENRVRYRWYPIVERAQTQMPYGEKHPSNGVTRLEGSRLLPSSGLCEEEPARMMTRHHTPVCGPLRPTQHHLDPTQLAAQAILRRSQASVKPLRRKRLASPGCSALRREVTMAA